MENILFFIVAILGGVMLIFVYKAAFGSVNIIRPNVFTFITYISIILQVYVSSLLLLYGYREHPSVSSIQNYDALFIQSFLYALYASLLMPIVVFSLSKGVGLKSGFQYYFSERPIILFHPSAENRLQLFRVRYLFVYAFIIYQFSFKGGALEYLIFNGFDYKTLMVLRSGAHFEESYVRIIRNIFGYGLGSIMAYTSFYYYRINREKLWVVLAYLILGWVMAFTTLAKGPVIISTLPYLFILVATGYKLNFRKMFIVFFGFFGIILLSYEITQMELIGSDLLSSDNITGRILIGQFGGVPNYLHIFPDQHEYLYGSGTSIASLFVVGTDIASRIAMGVHNPDGIISGTSGFQNTFFIADAYANFGILGLLLSPIWVGFVLFVYLYLFAKSTPQPFVLAFFLYISLLLMAALSGGFVIEWVLNTRVIGVSLLFIVLLNYIKNGWKLK